MDRDRARVRVRLRLRLRLGSSRVSDAKQVTRVVSENFRRKPQQTTGSLNCALRAGFKLEPSSHVGEQRHMAPGLNAVNAWL